MQRTEVSSLITLLALALALSVLPAPAYAAPAAKIETGRVANGDYAPRREAVGEQVRPERGYQTKLVLGDLVVRMVSHGIIDVAKIGGAVQGAGWYPGRAEAAPDSGL